MLGPLGHGKGIHDGFAGVVGIMLLRCSHEVYTSFDSSVFHPPSIHVFCPRPYLSKYRDARAGLPRELILGIASGVGRTLSWLVV